MRLGASFRGFTLQLRKMQMKRQATKTWVSKLRSATHESTDMLGHDLQDVESMRPRLHIELERWLDQVDETWFGDVKFLSERWQERVQLLMVQERRRATLLRSITTILLCSLRLAFDFVCRVC